MLTCLPRILSGRGYSSLCLKKATYRNMESVNPLFFNSYNSKFCEKRQHDVWNDGQPEPESQEQRSAAVAMTTSKKLQLSTQQGHEAAEVKRIHCSDRMSGSRCCTGRRFSRGLTKIASFKVHKFVSMVTVATNGSVHVQKQQKRKIPQKPITRFCDVSS